MKSYSIRERLDLIATSCCNSRMAELSRRAGIDKPVLSKIRSGIMSLTPYYIDKIISVNPSINRSWLETGVGYPGDLSIELVKERLLNEVEQKEKMIVSLMEQLETQRKVIEKLMNK